MDDSSSGEFVLERNNGEHLAFGIGSGCEIRREPVQADGITGESETYEPTGKTRVTG